MAVFVRGVIMLSVLVGLPAAWVYYGPLPEKAQQIVDRVVDVAREAIGQTPTTVIDNTHKAAPRFATESVMAAVAESPQPPVQLATAITGGTELPPQMSSTEAGLADELEPHLALLRSLGAAEYALEPWGTGGRLFRFHCAIPLAQSDDHTRQFEAIAADPAATVRQVVGEVTAWQNARSNHMDTRWR